MTHCYLMGSVCISYEVNQLNRGRSYRADTVKNLNDPYDLDF